jgi:hypothetical protein
MTAAEESSLLSLTERTLRQRTTPAKIALVCQFIYLESERLLQCRHCIRREGDQRLNHLKQAAREHLNLPGHAWCVEAEYVKQANAQSQMLRQGHATTRAVGRLQVQ